MSGQRAQGATGVFFLVNSDCSGCVAMVDRSLKRIDGISKVGINYVTDKVYVSYDPARVSPVQIRDTIKRAGCRALEQSHNKGRPARGKP